MTATFLPALPAQSDVDPWADLQNSSERRQAFDWGSVLPPADIDATGPLSPRESAQLAKLHTARNGTQNARWMRGAILESVNRRGLHRGESGERTWPEYLDQEWAGLSESQAYREIEEWRMGYAVSQIWEGIVADSHVRALLPLEEYGPRPEIAAAYSRMRTAWENDGKRLTAEHVRASVREFRAAAGALDVAVQVRELPAPVVPAPAKAASEPGAVEPQREEGTPSVTALGEPDGGLDGEIDDDPNPPPAEAEESGEREHIAALLKQLGRLAHQVGGRATRADAVRVLVDELPQHPGIWAIVRRRLESL
ncbi:hypothetical protein RCO28_20660 [Streptomyces sp. LHD-70]|uniref:hypothetical protein n=1 Tax=Streptomyces sp. LHD-70 TaxID=3072140 RepID=UPI00280FA1C0|nr:hypothetical protein [Streptomyces sp. LHD-70]MDQ8704885.1 hypothetical protein [Streptomyces sp. LHD-70]